MSCRSAAPMCRTDGRSVTHGLPFLRRTGIPMSSTSRACLEQIATCTVTICACSRNFGSLPALLWGFSLFLSKYSLALMVHLCDEGLSWIVIHRHIYSYREDMGFRESFINGFYEDTMISLPDLPPSMQESGFIRHSKDNLIRV